MIVFVRTKQVTEQLAERLRARGFSAAAINGDIVQPQRERTINQLRDAKLDILVATDVAARGLDVERISHVVNFDIPTDTESYVHRIGRTGRAGRTGDAISFVTPRERHLLKAIEKATRQPLTQMKLPSVEDVNETRVASFRDVDHRGAQLGPGRVLPRPDRGLRAGARRAGHRHRRGAGGADAGRPAAAHGAGAGAAPQKVFDGKREPRSGAWDHEKGRRRDDDRPSRRDAGKRRPRRTCP